MGEYQYDLVGEISAQIVEGYNVVNVDPESHMLVKSGDVVGWYMPDRQTIPFNKEGRQLLVRRVYGTQGAARRLDMFSHELEWCRTSSLRAIVRPTPGQPILVEDSVASECKI